MCGECQQKDDDQERHYTNELVETFTPKKKFIIFIKFLSDFPQLQMWKIFRWAYGKKKKKGDKNILRESSLGSSINEL